MREEVHVHHAPHHLAAKAVLRSTPLFLWLNMDKVEPSALSRDLAERVGDRRAMVRHVGAWKGPRNEAGVKADWQFTTVAARAKLRKLYPTTDA